ncbi:MAG: hypothetical protein ACW98J_04520 [Candidatus Thorarchaeota archaeon]|jgi:hypothetical protein
MLKGRAASSEYSLQQLGGEAFPRFEAGELAGSVGATQGPDIPCSWVKFKAHDDNAGTVFLGGVNVTVADGATDTTSGWPLESGEESPWFRVDNVNRIYRICDNAGDDCSYVLLGY